MTMNLYRVCDKHYEWSCFVFAPTRNRAKMLVADHFFENYIDMRCKTLKKGVNINYECVVDCEEDANYKLVQKCGFHYPTQEEIDAYYNY